MRTNTRARERGLQNLIFRKTLLRKLVIDGSLFDYILDDMSGNEQANTEQESENFIELSDFLENYPPNKNARITKICKGYRQTGLSVRYELLTPQLQLHCPSADCNGTRFYRCESNAITLRPGDHVNSHLIYRCQNCLATEKTFSISIRRDIDNKDGSAALTGNAIKLGEAPPFGPPTSSKLIKLIGPDREAFLKGRQCENQGLGIGAFVYYRRVVENQKSRILQQIIKVAEKIGADPDQVKLLSDAEKEIQFSKAMDIAKPALPESLLINGHNPLGLLHSALSEGLHTLSDEECLETAGSVRVVLNELSDRLSQALKDEAGLKAALGNLLNRKTK